MCGDNGIGTRQGGCIDCCHAVATRTAAPLRAGAACFSADLFEELHLTILAANPLTLVRPTRDTQFFFSSASVEWLDCPCFTTKSQNYRSNTLGYGVQEIFVESVAESVKTSVGIPTNINENCVPGTEYYERLFLKYFCL